MNRWRYAQSAFGPFTAIQKYAWSENDLPKPADFRRKLARSGGISIQDDMFRPQVARVGQPKSYNGILIHGPASRAFRSIEFRDIGFICFAIPYEDYSGWGAVFSVDILISECQNQGDGRGAGGGTSEGGVGPTWKKRPDQQE